MLFYVRGISKQKRMWQRRKSSGTQVTHQKKTKHSLTSERLQRLPVALPPPFTLTATSLKMAKNNFRDKAEGDELDLSMMSLTEVPVKEIASLPRITKIDLSSNQLTSIPSTFATSLPNITHLELGSNKLKEIPDNFNKLQNLKHLDLYNNKLKDLPVSLCQLRNLRWLDLKSNPLSPGLRKAAGDCQNQKECEVAARKVLAYLKRLFIQMEAEKMEKLRKEKEKEDAKMRAEEEKQAKKRAEKKAAKERKKAEHRAHLESQKVAANGSAAVEQPYTPVPKPQPSSHKHKKSKSGGWSLLGWMNFILFMCLLGASGFGLYVYSDGNLTPDNIAKSFPRVVENADVLLGHAKESLKAENLLQIWQTVSATVSEVSKTSWDALQQYTGDLSAYTDPLCEAISAGWSWITSYLVLAYNYLVNNVDWESILNSLKSAGRFLYEQWLVVCEELGKNEALMAVLATMRTHLATVGEFFGILWVSLCQQISIIVEYIREEGPGIVAVVKEQATGVLHTAKQSLEGFMK